MAQRKRTIKVCDRELKTVPATQTLSFSYLGANYELDLCDKHAAQLDREMASWTRVARETAATSTTFGDDSEQWRQLLEREAQHRRKYGVDDRTLASTFLRHGEDDDDVVADEPPAFNEWSLTDHAIERQHERGFTHEEVIEAAVAPERVFLDVEAGRRRHIRGRLCAIVDVDKKAVVTVFFRHHKDYLAHLEEKEQHVVSA